MSKYGIRFNLAAIKKSDVAIPDIILGRMNKFKMLGCEVIIYILNQVGNGIYHVIKYFGNIKLGINRFFLNKKKNDLVMYIYNLINHYRWNSFW